MLSDKSDSGQQVVHNSGRGQHKASVVDNFAVNTVFSSTKVKDSTVSKHRVLQSHFGWIKNHDVGSPVRGKPVSDPVEIYEDTGSMDLGKCQSIPLNNRYQVLEDQVSTLVVTVIQIVICRTVVG